MSWYGDMVNLLAFYFSFVIGVYFVTLKLYMHSSYHGDCEYFVVAYFYT